MPSAVLMASTNWRSFTSRMNTASGSPVNCAMAFRVAARPRASAGTEADGSFKENALIAALTSVSIDARSAAAPAGAGRRIALKIPGMVVSMPSRNERSFGGASTIDARRL